MPDITIRKLVELDKEAREKISAFQAEKDNFDAFLKMTRKEMIERHSQEIQLKINEAITKYNFDLQEKKQALSTEFSATLADIDDMSSQKKREWVEELYRACLE